MSKKAFFLSDLHLGAPYFPDSREAERRVVAFLDSIRHDASEIFLLGDILDYWYEYRYVVPRGFVRFFGKLAELSDAGVKITWLIGNHDIWIFDYLPSELGVEVVDGILEREIMGSRFVLSHGDGIPPSPPTFRFLRSLFRNKICQKLFSGIHPRWTVRFAQTWSRHSREHGLSPMASSHPLLDNFRNFSLNHFATHKDVRFYIFGHLHILHRESLDESQEITISDSITENGNPTAVRSPELVVLGDWINYFSYAVFDGNRLSLNRFSAR